MNFLGRILSAIIAPEGPSIPEVEPSFGGVSLSELNKIAQSTSQGLKVEVDGISLIFYYRSARGRSTRYARISIDDYGKLCISFDAHYPGQVYHAASAFVKQANELFTFRR